MLVVTSLRETTRTDATPSPCLGPRISRAPPTNPLAAPSTLNFRLFQPLRIVDGTSAHVTVTSDGAICGFDDEWFCRTVHVQASHAGMLRVDATSDDPSIRPSIAIRALADLCCEAPAPVKVDAGEEALVYVLLWWNGPVSAARTGLEYPRSRHR